MWSTSTVGLAWIFPLVLMMARVSIAPEIAATSSARRRALAERKGYRFRSERADSAPLAWSADTSRGGVPGRAARLSRAAIRS